MTPPHPARVVVAGIFVLIIVMGIGRFAYTMLVAPMIASGLTEGTSGIIAALNLAGYLAGALASGFIKTNRTRYIAFVMSLALSVGSTALMAAGTSTGLWFTARLLSGIASGGAFVLCSSIVIDGLAAAGRVDLSLLFFTGTGLGIALGGLLAPIFEHAYGMQAAWAGLAVVCAPMAVYSVITLRPRVDYTPKSATVIEKRPAADGRYKRLLAAYFLEGFGYIIYATFVVVLVKDITRSAEAARWMWVMAGVSAAVAVPLWRLLAVRMGHRNALMTAFAVQAAGVFIPAVTAGLPAVFLSGAVFGGTFMGVSALSIQYGVHLNPATSNKTVAIMTVIYSVGQVMGPVIAGYSAEIAGSFRPSFILSALCLCAACFILSRGVRGKG